MPLGLSRTPSGAVDNSVFKEFLLISLQPGRHDIYPNDTYHNDCKHSNKQRHSVRDKGPAEYYNTVIMLSEVMLSVVILSLIC